MSAIEILVICLLIQLLLRACDSKNLQTGYPAASPAGSALCLKTLLENALGPCLQQPCSTSCMVYIACWTGEDALVICYISQLLLRCISKVKFAELSCAVRSNSACDLPGPLTKTEREEGYERTSIKQLNRGAGTNGAETRNLAHAAPLSSRHSRPTCVTLGCAEPFALWGSRIQPTVAPCRL